MDAEKLIPDATAKLLCWHEFDHTVFKLNSTWAFNYDVINRLGLESSFEAILDAGELILLQTAPLVVCIVPHRGVNEGN